jgi:hypothetical protein
MTDSKPETLLDRVLAMADELKLEGEEKAKYVDQHMSKAGWVRKLDYSPPEGGGDAGKKNDGWFS